MADASVSQTSPVWGIPSRCAAALGSTSQTSPVWGVPSRCAATMGAGYVSVVTFYILAETGDVINAENSDRTRTE